MKIGPYVLTVTEDCPIAGGKLLLVVISHGRGGDFLGHHDTAEALAEAGFVAVAINHPGDTARDKSRTDDPSVFVERPSDIKRTIDFMLGAWSDSARIDPTLASATANDTSPTKRLSRLITLFATALIR